MTILVVLKNMMNVLRRWTEHNKNIHQASDVPLQEIMVLSRSANYDK